MTRFRQKAEMAAGKAFARTSNTEYDVLRPFKRANRYVHTYVRTYVRTNERTNVYPTKTHERTNVRKNETSKNTKKRTNENIPRSFFSFRSFVLSFGRSYENKAWTENRAWTENEAWTENKAWTENQRGYFN